MPDSIEVQIGRLAERVEGQGTLNRAALTALQREISGMMMEYRRLYDEGVKRNEEDHADLFNRVGRLERNWERVAAAGGLILLVWPVVTALIVRWLGMGG